MTVYTPLDGRNHKWDDLGEAARMLVAHYRRVIKSIITGTRVR